MDRISYGYAMNRNHLALFHAVAQAGGISRGAERARVSQPAVSKQIRELEATLGVPLLERLPRGSRLTDAGRILSEYAERLAGLEREAEEAIEEFRGIKRGRLAVGASTTIGAYLLPQAFSEFHRRHPRVDLRLEIANTRQVQRLLMEDEVEIGLTEGVVEARHLHAEVVHEDELVFIAPRGHALLKKRRVTARELCREPFILREEGSGTRAVFERALAKYGLGVKPVLLLAGTEAVKRAVEAGLGVAVVSRLTIGLELRVGSLGIVPVKDLELRRPLHLQRLHGRNFSPAAAEFMEMLTAADAHGHHPAHA